MKLLFLTKEETSALNVQYLLQGEVQLVYDYEELLELLHGNVDTLGFTTQAITLCYSSSQFINTLEGIKNMFDYKLVYFAETSDSISDYMNNTSKCAVVNSLSECSEVTILEALNMEIEVSNKEISKMVFRDDPKITNRIHSWMTSLEHDAPTVLKEINQNPDKLLEILVMAKHIQMEIQRKRKENNMLLTQKQHLLALAEDVDSLNDSLTNKLKKLKHAYDHNNTLLLRYKTSYDQFQQSIHIALKHGIQNLKEDCYESIKCPETVYPMCVVYLKQVTHCNYMSSFIDALMQLMTQKSLSVKLLKVLPKGASGQLVKYENYINITNGFNYSTYKDYSKFLHLGNPYTALNTLLKNEVPVDVLIIVDETPLDYVYCHGDNVILYYLANSYRHIKDLSFTPVASIVNEGEGDNVLRLDKYEDYEKLSSNSQLTTLYYEQQEVTQNILSSVNQILRGR